MSFTAPLGNGYQCARCRTWVMNGCTHFCSGYTWLETPHFTWPLIVTTTLTVDAGALLRITREDDAYFVTDVIGTRYGHGMKLADALSEWAAQVEDLLGMDEATLGEPLLSEVKSYRKALNRA